MKRSVVLVAGLLLGCGDLEHDFQVVPTLPDCVPAGKMQIALTALGDFPPAPARTTTGGQLDLPANTRVLEVEGNNSNGLVAFGRTPPSELAKLPGKIAVNFGAPDTLCATADMHYARAAHQATLLASGEVLISGGHDLSGFPVPKMEAYVPYAAPPSFRVVDADGKTALDARAALGHTVMVLPAGDFYITGGVKSQGGSPDGASFLGWSHHSATGVEIGSGVLSGDGRAFHTATVLGDGRAILIGGCERFDSSGCVSPLGSSVIYDKGQFSDGPSLLHARYGHQALLRGDGKILIVGGGAPAEIFDVGTGGSDLLDIPGVAARLPTGAVLAISASAANLLVEDSLVPVTPLPGARMGQTLTTLEDGAVLVAGGALDPDLVLYDPISGPRSIPGPFARREHAATRLGDGSVLLTGGTSDSNKAAIFLHSPLGPYSNLATLTFESASAPLVPLRPDRVRFTGGQLEITDSFALLSALELGNFQLTFLAEGNAELLVGWQSEAHYGSLTLIAGQPVTLSTPTGTFTGDPLDSNEISISWRKPNFEVLAAGKRVLQCRPGLDRGAIGLGATSGTARFDDLAVTR